MAGITLADAQDQLAVWLAASKAVARNQAYDLPDGRKLTRADAATIRDNVDFWNKKCKELSPSSSRSRVRRGVPLV